MKEDKKDINVLDELNKGACMGRDAIHFIMDKVKDDNLKKELNRQYAKYKETNEKICELYPEYNEGEPHKTGTMNKVMTWYGIEMKTLLDDSTSKIAELLMQGTNMGIIEGRRLLNDKNMDDEVHKICEEYVTFQEEAVEKEGYILDTVEYVKEDSNMFLRVIIDKNGIIDIDDCVLISKLINPILDSENIIEDSYILDVCSKEKGSE